MKRLLSPLLLTYFRMLARVQLKKIQPLVIGITGSAGKTSTLHACEAVLQEHYQVKISHKANSESGIPLNILDLHPSSYSVFDWLRLCVQAIWQVLFNWKPYDVYLVEMGIDSPLPPKNMSYLLGIVQPEIGVFLNVAPTHAETFDHLVTASDVDSRKQQLISLIAQEKGKLITQLPASGVAILNADDPAVLDFKTRTQATVITHGSKKADLHISSIQWVENSTQITFTYDGESDKLSIKGYMLPKSYAATFAAAICVGLSQRLSLKACIHALEKGFTLPPGRSSLIAGINGSHIIDSSYNASTQPMLDMLELLAHAQGKKKYALLGDMREIGQVTQSEHELVASHAARICDAVFLIGPYMKEFALPVLQSKKINVQWYPTAAHAAKDIATMLKPDDVLLVKGSQNTLLLEIAVEMLMAEPQKAAKLLCRRGTYWDKQRAKLTLPG